MKASIRSQFSVISYLIAEYWIVHNPSYKKKLVFEIIVICNDTSYLNASGSRSGDCRDAGG